MSSSNVISILLLVILLTILIQPFISHYFSKSEPLVPLTALPEEILNDLDSRIERYSSAAIETKLMYNIIRSTGNSARPNLANGTLLREDFLEETVAETVADILASLSPQYKALLSTAIPEEIIEDYILERVYLRIFNFSRDYNFEVLGITSTNNPPESKK